MLSLQKNIKNLMQNDLQDLSTELCILPFAFQTILSYWDNYRENMLAALRPMKNLIWRGDGRFDSMGHNAKYGIYSMYCSSNSKISAGL